MYGIKTSRLFLSNLSEINRHLRKLSPVLHKPLKDAKKNDIQQERAPSGRNPSYSFASNLLVSNVNAHPVKALAF